MVAGKAPQAKNAFCSDSLVECKRAGKALLLLPAKALFASQKNSSKTTELLDSKSYHSGYP
jgi:hypothetical protein